VFVPCNSLNIDIDICYGGILRTNTRSISVERQPLFSPATLSAQLPHDPGVSGFYSAPCLALHMLDRGSNEITRSNLLDKNKRVHLMLAHRTSINEPSQAELYFVGGYSPSQMITLSPWCIWRISGEDYNLTFILLQAFCLRRLTYRALPITSPSIPSTLYRVSPCCLYFSYSEDSSYVIFQGPFCQRLKLYSHNGQGFRQSSRRIQPNDDAPRLTQAEDYQFRPFVPYSSL
jgi:hypothetical protein